MKLVFPRLYAIMDGALLRTSELAFAEMLAESGVKLIQYRNKRLSSRGLFEISQQLRRFLKPRGVKYVVNDRPDVAAMVEADAVHVGQEDLGVEEARAICGRACWVGVSTHTPEQVRLAAETSADYIAVGPIFHTETKENPDAVVGVEFVRQARRLTEKPLVAIGGIMVERAREVYRAGADSVAIARDLLWAADPLSRVREYLALATDVAGEAV